MNFEFNSQRILQRCAVPLLLMVAVVAWGQHNKTENAPKAPASHASTSHSNAPSHTSTSSHSSTTSHSTTSSRPSNTRPSNTMSRPSTTTNRSNTTNRPGTTTHTGTTSRTTTTTHAGGTTTRSTTTTHTGTTTHTAMSRTPPGRTMSLRGGGTANIRPNGSIRSIDRNGMHIEHGVGGRRTVVSERNGARIVTSGRGGYVQRAYVVRGGRTFVSRTYVYGGVVHVGVYRSFYWGGHPYYGWYPGYFWHPGFYGWAWHPWGAPVYWGVGLWGWGGAPWWGFYGGWWNPYPYYAAPAFWLTDYLISQQLQAAYAARQEAAADDIAADAQASAPPPSGGDQQASGGAVALTPEVKEAIAEEVKAQIAAQQAQAQQASGGAPAPAAATASSAQVPPALDPAQRTFVVDTPVTGVASTGQECGLTSGDVVTRLTDTPDSNQMVNASVSASKKGECAAGQTVTVKVDDLQEMYNHFQEQLQNGMSELAKKQGTNGMPSAPDTGTSASDVPPPAADPNAAKQLQDQQAQADQTEAQVKQEAAAGGQ